MNCSRCSTPLPEASRFCPNCGADASDPGATTERFDTDPGIRLMGQLARAVEGHYRVDRILGRGGMGTVLLAEDLVLERPVAIKVLPPEYAADERLVGRFEREARTAAKLDHHCIVPIFAVESQAGLHFFVMKYIAGRSLQEALQSGPLPFDVCRRVLFDAADALGHAHRRGVIHRDIKPGNIMLDDEGRTVVTDFGISKAVQSEVSFTATGQIVGTPHYMSPEQAKGVELDGRADQYSLAVVGYQVLTGRLPFEADSSHGVLYKHVSEPPPPIEEFRPDAPPALSRAIMRALGKEPGDRFPTMEAFGAAVWPERGSRALLRTPEEPRAPLTAVPPARRPRLATGVVAAAVTVAVVGLAYYAVAHRGDQGAIRSPAGETPLPTVAPPVDTGAAPPSARPSDASQAAAPTPTPGPSPPRQEPGTTGPPARTPEPTQRRDQTPAPQQAVGFLTMDSDPFGTVSLNGVDVGDTPLVRHALAAGTYMVRVSRDGYRTWSASITITAGNTESRRIQLVPVP